MQQHQPASYRELTDQEFHALLRSSDPEAATTRLRYIRALDLKQRTNCSLAMALRAIELADMKAPE